MIDPAGQIAGLNQALALIREDIKDMKSQQKELVDMMNELSSGRISSLERDVAVLHERVGILQKLVYGATGAALLAIVAAIMNAVIL